MPTSRPSSAGLLPRRALLGGGLALASAVAAPREAGAAEPVPAEGERPPWMRVPGRPFSGYGAPSRFEEGLQRRIGANRAVPGNGVSWTPPYARSPFDGPPAGMATAFSGPARLDRDADAAAAGER